MVLGQLLILLFNLFKLKPIFIQIKAKLKPLHIN